MRMVALSKPKEQRGLDTGTLNRHLTFIFQLFELAEAQGVDLDPKLRVAKLRSIASDEGTRDRDERLKLDLSRIEALFMQASFVNCAGWDELSKEGAPGTSLVFHGALYFIPMMIFYGGGNVGSDRSQLSQMSERARAAIGSEAMDHKIKRGQGGNLAPGSNPEQGFDPCQRLTLTIPQICPR